MSGASRRCSENTGSHFGEEADTRDPDGRRLCKAANKAGIESNLVLYDFRHTFAMRMAKAGIDLATLAAILGHSSIESSSCMCTPPPSKNAMLRYDEMLRVAEEKSENAERRIN